MSSFGKGSSGEGKEADVDEEVSRLVKDLCEQDPEQEEFHQAAEEILVSLKPLFKKRPEYLHVARVMMEPERIVRFRVSWFDDDGVQHVNRGYRCQVSSALGPYKGGMRFHPSVRLGTLRFLGTEQVLKNALSGLPLGGGKGGSDFNPKGRSDAEVRRFCEALMLELYRHIGADTDVPAGDIGVGAREIGYLAGAYKRTANLHTGGVLTGKGVGWGGSEVRTEATGYGLVYLVREFMDDHDDKVEGKRVLVSGSGNVATYASKKFTALGAKVLTMSDSDGTVVEPDGFTEEQIEEIIVLKTQKRGRISEYSSGSSKYHKGKTPWQLGLDADIVAPCATQNELGEDDAGALAKDSGVKLLAEGANMPSTNEAIEVFKSNGVRILPAKAANCGGVATSGLEMSQNSERDHWDADKVDERLQSIMKGIYKQSKEAAAEYGLDDDLQFGANAAGFIRVADAMIAQGFAVPK